MNNDLIRREDAINALLKDTLKFDGSLIQKGAGTLVRESEVYFCLDKIPCVDAELVRHGIWEPDPVVFVCSICHKWFKLDFDFSGTPTARMNYCPNCGARMDGEGYGE